MRPVHSYSRPQLASICRRTAARTTLRLLMVGSGCVFPPGRVQVQVRPPRWPNLGPRRPSPRWRAPGLWRTQAGSGLAPDPGLDSDLRQGRPCQPARRLRRPRHGGSWAGVGRWPPHWDRAAPWASGMTSSFHHRDGRRQQRPLARAASDGTWARPNVALSRNSTTRRATQSLCSASQRRQPRV